MFPYRDIRLNTNRKNGPEFEAYKGEARSSNDDWQRRESGRQPERGVNGVRRGDSGGQPEAHSMHARGRNHERRRDSGPQPDLTLGVLEA